MKLKRKYQTGGIGDPVPTIQNPNPYMTNLMWGQLPNIQGQYTQAPQMPTGQEQTSPFQIQKKRVFGDINYDWRGASNTIQAIAAGFRGLHQNKEQDDYYRKQFNPLNIIEQTGNTSEQNQFGQSYMQEGGEVDEIFRLPKMKKGGHLILKDTLIHGKKISAKQRKFFSDLYNMQLGGNINTTGYLDGVPTAQNNYNIIPGDDITMKGVSKKIQATPIYNGMPGQPTVMHPGLDYSFKGADAVHEQPFNTTWDGSIPTFNYNKQIGKNINLNLNTTPFASYAKGPQFGIGLTKSFQTGGPIDFEKDFEDDLFTETPKEVPQEVKEEAPEEQSFSQDDTTPEWLKYLLGDDNIEQTNISTSSKTSLNGFQSFGTPEDGRIALEGQLNLYKTGKTHNNLNGNSTLLEAMQKYAPDSDNNNSLHYAQFVAKNLGVSIHTPISRLNTKTWADQIVKMEGSKTNNVGNLRKFK